MSILKTTLLITVGILGLALVAQASLSCAYLGIRTNSLEECQYYVARYTNYPLANWIPSTGECRACNP